MTGAEEARVRARLDAAGLVLGAQQPDDEHGREVWNIICRQCRQEIPVCIRRYVAEPQIGPWCGRCGEAVK